MQAALHSRLLRRAHGQIRRETHSHCHTRAWQACSRAALQCLCPRSCTRSRAGHLSARAAGLQARICGCGAHRSTRGTSWDPSFTHVKYLRGPTVTWCALASAMLLMMRDQGSFAQPPSGTCDQPLSQVAVCNTFMYSPAVFGVICVICTHARQAVLFCLSTCRAAWRRARGARRCCWRHTCHACHSCEPQGHLIRSGSILHTPMA